MPQSQTLVNDAISIQTAPAAESQEAARLTLCGGGNFLLAHLGALHRLYELGCLQGMEIHSAGGSFFTTEELRVLDQWNRRSKNKIDDGQSIAGEFGMPVRALRRKGRWANSWRWRPPSELHGRPDEFYARLRLRPDCELSWGVTDVPVNHERSFAISQQRHEELIKLALTPQHLPELGMDYLIDWGYVLCEGVLSRNKVGASSERTSFASPNRLFYRSFSFAHGVSAQLLIPGSTEEKAVPAGEEKTVPAGGKTSSKAA